jgi:hypothetical protein
MTTIKPWEKRQQEHLPVRFNLHVSVIFATVLHPNDCVPILPHFNALLLRPGRITDALAFTAKRQQGCAQRVGV